MKHLPDQTRLRVASYNIRKARGLDQRRNPTRILAVINHLGADVVALQEADRRFGDRPSALCRGLIERETDFQVADLAPNEVSLGWHGNAILIRKGGRRMRNALTCRGSSRAGRSAFDLTQLTRW